MWAVVRTTTPLHVPLHTPPPNSESPVSEQHPTHEQQEAFFRDLRESIDTGPAPTRPTKAGRGAAAPAPAARGAGVIAVLRGLLLAGVPWTMILTKILPDVVTRIAAGEKLPQVISEIVTKWLSGGYKDQPAAAPAADQPQGGSSGQ